VVAQNLTDRINEELSSLRALTQDTARAYFIDADNKRRIIRLLRFGAVGFEFRPSQNFHVFAELYSQVIDKFMLNPEVSVKNNFRSWVEMRETLEAFDLTFNFYANATSLQKAMMQSNISDQAELALKPMMCLSLDKLDLVNIDELIALMPNLQSSQILLSVMKTRYHFAIPEHKLSMLVDRFIESAPDEMHALSIQTNTFFFSSYWSSESANDFKKAVCAGIPRTKNQYNLEAATSRNTRKQRLLITHERYKPNASMVRSWGKVYDLLESHFEVTHLLTGTDGGCIHPGKDTFFGPVENTEEAEEIIKKIRPDVIFLPSVGMGRINFYLANQRLAKLQVAGLGHPVTYAGREIDRIIVSWPIPSIDSHHQVLDSIPITFPTIFKDIEVNYPLNPNSQIVSVYAKVQKLSRDFLLMLLSVQEFAPDIKFQFLAGEVSLNHLAVKASLERFGFNDVTVFPNLDYDRVLEVLSKSLCSIAPYPFGGWDSVVDVCHVGIPHVAVVSDNPGSTDQHFLRHLGLSDRVFDDRAELIAYVSRLASEPEFFKFEARRSKLAFETIRSESSTPFSEVQKDRIISTFSV